jgi:hypothetical protein
MVETARQIAIRRAAQALDRSSAFPLIFPDFPRISKDRH